MGRSTWSSCSPDAIRRARGVLGAAAAITVALVAGLALLGRRAP